MYSYCITWQLWLLVILQITFHTRHTQHVKHDSFFIEIILKGILKLLVIFSFFVKVKKYLLMLWECLSAFSLNKLDSRFICIVEICNYSTYNKNILKLQNTFLRFKYRKKNIKYSQGLGGETALCCIIVFSHDCYPLVHRVIKQIHLNLINLSWFFLSISLRFWTLF